MVKIGSHVSFKKPDYLVGSCAESLNNKATCMMIFLGPPQSTFRANKEEYKLQEYLEKYSEKYRANDIIIHAPYIINLASPLKHEFGENFLISEIKRMNYIKAKYIVLHPGSSTNFSKEESIKQLINSLKRVISETEDAIICLETMAGKGNELCRSFEEIMLIINEVKSDRLKICLDTCHVWDAGYNIQDYDNFKKYLKENNFLDYIKVIHLNDSLNERGSKKDKHANIDKGYIGLETLKKFVFDEDFKDICKVLETPLTLNKNAHKEEIALLLKG
ncbi:endonuclease IV [Metamycoplasma subdolum]|uniref:Probable endonuclease 4 n=1 Tax=Metamycoplasma subdolum TaxID=92407 RepID=A0A3M0AEC8_9BACT|nr:deoxyribonuclease IV [Metamycoplasma subdolum]RMA77532.1 endonuclease IV [Metamycoplasma subdolum]WPB50725.1 deoxyribonuclease IV [Metamycoplasma subdolum]